MESNAFGKWHILFTINEVWIYKKNDWRSHFNYSYYKNASESYDSMQTAIINNKYLNKDQLEKLFNELSANESHEDEMKEDNDSKCLSDETIKDYDFINNGLPAETVKVLGDNLFKK